MYVVCDNCGKEFNKKPSHIAKTVGDKHYCSIACSSKGKTNGKECACATCGKAVWKTKKAMDKSQSGDVFCSHSCAAKKSNMSRSDYKWAYRSLALRKLPNVCAICGYSEVPEVLHVHHIDRDRQNNDISNLQILCPTCHYVDHFTNRDGPYKL